MTKYKSEASINKLLAELQLAGAAIDGETIEKPELTFEEMLREALASENEAIEIYTRLTQRAEALGSGVLTKAFMELAEDEKKHVGNLQYLMKLLCPDTAEVEKDGEAEEAVTQAQK